MFKLAQEIRKKYWCLFSIKTKGVRVILIKDNKILLLQHRYNDLWVLPGGQLSKDENVYIGGKREVAEETPYVIDSFSCNLGIYKNRNSGKNDEVTVLVSKNFRVNNNKKLKDRLISFIEIKEIKWFDFDNLSKNVSSATRRRISEYLKSPKNQIFGDW